VTPGASTLVHVVAGDASEQGGSGRTLAFPPFPWSPRPKLSLSGIVWPTAVVAASAVAATLALSGVTSSANAASSDACEGGGFSLVNKTTGAVVADFAVLNYAFTGAANEEDITGGRRTPVFASKVPNHRGLSLSSSVTVELEDEDLVITRTGTGLSMKV
jgi:hypothetical protein